MTFVTKRESKCNLLPNPFPPPAAEDKKEAEPRLSEDSKREPTPKSVPKADPDEAKAKTVPATVPLPMAAAMATPTLAASQGPAKIIPEKDMVSEYLAVDEEEEAGNKSVVLDETNGVGNNEGGAGEKTKEADKDDLRVSATKARSECNDEHSFVEPAAGVVPQLVYEMQKNGGKRKSQKKDRNGKDTVPFAGLLPGRLLPQTSEPDLPRITPSFSRRILWQFF